MLITETTKYSEFQPLEKYLKADGFAQIKRAAEEQYGNMYDLTFAEFHACANGDFGGILGDLSNPTVLQVYWIKRLEEFTEEFANTLKRLEIKQTADEQRAAQGLLKTDWAEGILIFLQSFFSLKSFKEAEKITMGEIIIAKRSQYNGEVFRRNMTKIQMQKARRK